jgi:hypothetical protein
LILQSFLFLPQKCDKFLPFQNQWLMNLTPCDRLRQGHIHTALKIVATKQDVEVAVDSAKSELEAKIGEVKSDVLMLDSKVVKKIQSINRRTTNIEDQSGIENPEKH